MAGVGFQQLFVLVFIVLAITFQRKLAREGAAYRKPGVLRLLYVLYAVLGLITVRVSHDRFYELYDADLLFAHRCVSSFDWSNIQAASIAVSPTTKPTSIVSTRYRCLLLLSFSTFPILAGLCLAKRAIYPAGKKGSS